MHYHRFNTSQRTRTSMTTKWGSVMKEGYTPTVLKTNSTRNGWIAKKINHIQQTANMLLRQNEKWIGAGPIAVSDFRTSFCILTSCKLSNHHNKTTCDCEIADTAFAIPCNARCLNYLTHQLDRTDSNRGALFTVKYLPALSLAKYEVPLSFSAYNTSLLL